MVTEINDGNIAGFIADNQFVLIDCWAPWCGPCRRMGPIIDELSEELAGKVAVGKLNTDDNQSTSAKYGITAIPTLLVFKNGEYIGDLVGLRPKQDIIAYLSSQGMISREKKAEASAEGGEVADVGDATFEEFIRSKEYALVDCWAPWCGPCRRMGPIVEGMAKIAGDKIAVGKLNVDENPIVSLQYNIQSIPTLLIYKNGKQVDTIVGLSPTLSPEVLRDTVLSH